MPKVNVYLPDELAAAVRDANVPVSAICQVALERAVREVTAARNAVDTPGEGAASSVGLFGRFTPRARHSVAQAEEAARDVPHDYVGTEHLLLGMLATDGNLALRVLADMDIDVDDLAAELGSSMPPPSATAPGGHIPFTPRSKRVLELTAKEALAMGHNYIGCEHILLGLLAVDDGLASKVLRRMGVELRTTRLAVVAALSGFVASPPAAPASATPEGPAAPPASDDTLRQILDRLDAIERRLGS